MDVKLNNKTEMSRAEATVWFWGLVGFFALLWVLLPSLLHTGYRQDIIEISCAGSEWALAIKKHPMLPAWILEILNMLTNRAFAVPFIASQLCTILALWSVWKLGRTVLNNERLALLGAFSLLPYRFFTSVSPQYNHNIVLIPFWCLSIYLVFQALQTNQKRYWISAGIVLGLTFHAKYSAVFLVIAILTYMFTQERMRQFFRTPGPWVTTFIAFLIFLPHIIWLFHHNFEPLRYASNHPDLTQWYWHILAPLSFAVRQVAFWIPTLIIMIPVIGLAWKWKIQHQEQTQAKECEKFLFYCMMVPLVCHMLYAGIGSVHLLMAYGAPFWVFGGLWFLLRFQANETRAAFRRAVIVTIAIGLCILAEWVTTFYAGKQVPVVYYPMQQLGQIGDQLWHKYASGNCPYIAGDDGRLNGYVAHTMTVRPSAILRSGYWANNDDLNRKGGMIVWERANDETGMPEELRRDFPTAEILPERPELPYKVGSKTRVLKLGFAIVPPPENPQNVR